MSDKTPLELDIEHLERFRTPPGVKAFIIILVIGVCLSAAYALKLRRDIEKTEQEIVLLKDNFQKEKDELLGRIKEFENRQIPPEPPSD